VNKSVEKNQPKKAKWKKILLYASIGLFGASAIAAGVGFAVGVEETTFLFLLGAVGLSLELVFWAVAIVFGISMYESRKKIWAGIKSKFSRKPRPAE